MVHALCQAYNALPGAGGVLDQDVSFLRMHAVIALANEEPDATPVDPVEALEALIPMETL